eukprot:Amastigsp_a522760_4.p3 type:complete len:151 gc:universal Amastigsp_a522760_4:141-593(+)
MSAGATSTSGNASTICCARKAKAAVSDRVMGAGSSEPGSGVTDARGVADAAAARSLSRTFATESCDAMRWLTMAEAVEGSTFAFVPPRMTVTAVVVLSSEPRVLSRSSSFVSIHSSEPMLHRTSRSGSGVAWQTDSSMSRVAADILAGSG